MSTQHIDLTRSPQGASVAHIGATGIPIGLAAAGLIGALALSDTVAAPVVVAFLAAAVIWNGQQLLVKKGRTR